MECDVVETTILPSAFSSPAFAALTHQRGSSRFSPPMVSTELCVSPVSCD